MAALASRDSVSEGILCTHACNMINLTISHTWIGVKFHPEYWNLTHSWPHLYLYRSHNGDSAHDTQNEMSTSIVTGPLAPSSSTIVLTDMSRILNECHSASLINCKRAAQGAAGLRRAPNAACTAHVSRSNLWRHSPLTTQFLKGIMCTHACNMINLTISHTLIGVKFHPEYLSLTHSWPQLSSPGTTPKFVS